MMSGSARNATIVCNEPNTPDRVSGVRPITLLTRLAIPAYSGQRLRMSAGVVSRSFDAHRNTSATERPPRCAANR